MSRSTAARSCASSARSRTPPARVWAAITDPDRLAKWFPTTVEFDELRLGAPIAFRFAEDPIGPMSGAFREVSPPRRLSFTWGDDVLTFELEERDGGAACRLSFSVVLDSADKAARDSAGWDDCLDMLDAVVAGETPERPGSRGAGGLVTMSTSARDSLLLR